MRYKILLWIFHQSWLTRYKLVHEKLMKAFAQQADHGNQDAQELFGFLLLHKGSDAGSKSQGARYLMMCANVHRPKVCWQLHLIYKTGDVLGFNANVEKANLFFNLAKEGGHPLAQETLPV